MATKVQSPTQNLFTLLAEDPANRPQAQKKPAQAAKAAEHELTPKARAEAKAQQDAERKRQQAANKAKQQTAPVEQQIELDDSGFAKQRNQRVKENKLNSRSAPVTENKKEKTDKPFKRDNNKQNNNNRTSVTGGDDSRPFKENNRPPKAQGGYKPRPEGAEGQRTGRQFDKQSAGKYPRQPYAKKGGNGKGNWGTQNDQVKPEEEHPQEEVATETPEATATEAAPATDAETPAQPAEEQKKVEESEKLLSDFLAEKEAQRKKLAELVGGLKSRELTEEEKSSIQKFTLVENSKAKKVVNQTKPAEGAQAKTTAASARKGEKAIEVASIIGMSEAPQRGPGRGGRKPRGGRGGQGHEGGRTDNRENNNNNNNRGGNRRNNNRTQRTFVPTDDKQFPTLSK